MTNDTSKLGIAVVGVGVLLLLAGRSESTEVESPEPEPTETNQIDVIEAFGTDAEAPEVEDAGTTTTSSGEFGEPVEVTIEEDARDFSAFQEETLDLATIQQSTDEELDFGGVTSSRTGL